jgi:hydroxymethylpyrimidine/phosphomethylpyrimidine kinase
VIATSGSGTPRRVLIVAGSDSGGGAGIQADLKTIAAFGGYGMTAITALTAQNTLGISGILPVPAAFVANQMRAVLDDIGADAIKIGMLGDAAIVECVVDILASLPRRVPIVLDTVMAATRGGTLLDAGGIEALKRRLMPASLLVTPNLPEAEILTGLQVRDLDGMRRAAAALQAMGAPNVLIKGGHLDSDAIVDLLAGEGGETLFRNPRIASRHTHGTGCVLASAIAVCLAQGASLVEAVACSIGYVRDGIRTAPALGQGNGPLGMPAARPWRNAAMDAMSD